MAKSILRKSNKSEKNFQKIKPQSVPPAASQRYFTPWKPIYLFVLTLQLTVHAKIRLKAFFFVRKLEFVLLRAFDT